MVLQLHAKWQALGLGLVLPRGGFAVAGGWRLRSARATVLFFAVALAAWIFTANLAAVFVVWLGAAALSPRPMRVTGSTRRRSMDRLGLRSRGGGLAWIRGVAPSSTRDGPRRVFVVSTCLERCGCCRALWRAVPDAARRAGNCLRAARRAAFLDRPRTAAGRRVCRFHDVIDQFQNAASLRYQINYLHYSLALAQAHYSAELHGYLSLAQRSLLTR